MRNLERVAMQVHLTAETEAKLKRRAEARGRNAEELAREAIEQYVNYGDWFATEVETGLDQFDRGRSLSHAEVGVRIEALLAGKRTLRKWS